MSIEVTRNHDDIITQLRNECLKEYRVYDAQNRAKVIYQTRTSAKHGDVCLKTTSVFDGTANRILKKKEEPAQWDSTWDV